MAFFLTPRFAPAYQCNPYSGYCAPSRPVYRQSRPSFPSFVPFLAQVDELLSEIDRESRREAQRAAHIARLQRKRACRQRFNVEENKEGWEVQAEIPGFEQENVQIEVTDEQTLKISGNTEWKNEHAQAEAAPVEAAPATELEAEKTAEAENTEDMDGVTITEADAVPTPTGSDTESHKSYQPTVEDDFEDLGAETSSTVSAASASEAPKDSKGKEKVVDEPATTVAPQQQPEAPAQQQQEAEEKFQGSFERTFKFPVRIDAGNVRATFKEGVLSINVPKAPAHQVRQITIQ
ncbi:HSP20-like chaperone [Lophiotrema nucula]|uniref:HSP20-like chaperone n=1 Tax=Lophiotrema nucula TaxID=690887 RepID=A0A6A5ZFR5_9PLEO|nr:HSP20-like chaperone [Lophiotrema nucula]